MNINIRYCKRCKKAYDIGLNLELCPECRQGKYSIESKGGKNNNGKMLEM